LDSRRIYKFNRPLNGTQDALGARATTPRWVGHNPTSQQPFNGDLLLIMPWPDFQSLTEHELRAIYEYLRAIPCLEGTAN